MTSKPASRRRRATTLAPRSWPSMPAFATTTLMGRPSRLPASRERGGMRLEVARVVILPEDLAQRVHDLADRGVGVDGFQDRRDEVGAAEGGFADVLQGALPASAAASAEILKSADLLLLQRVVDLQDGNAGIVVLGDVAIHADDDLFTCIDARLMARGGIGDLHLREARFDGRHHAA